MNAKKSQADVLGALMFMGLMFIASFTIFSALSYYFAAQESYSNAMAYSSAYNKQNLSVLYVQALPPSANSGIVVSNYGEPVQLIYLVEEGSDGSLTFQPINVYLRHGQSVNFATNTPYSGVMTSYAGLFMTNFSEPMIPVSEIAVNVSVNFQPQLEYVTPGYYFTTAPYSVKWFVNGTYVHSGRTLELYICGPTSITAVPVNSFP